MNLYETRRFFITLLIFHSILLFTGGHSTHHWRCEEEDTFTYNVCHDPVHPGLTFSRAAGSCSISEGFTGHLISVTSKLIDDLHNETVTFANQHIRCTNRVQNLETESVASILGFQPLQQYTSGNSVTDTYMKIIHFLRLFQKLSCLYSSKAEEECCLSFSQTFLRLKHRVLSKWWIIQNNCGEPINQCDVTVPNLTNEDLQCEDYRNMIYILLRDARSLLQESVPVAMAL